MPRSRKVNQIAKSIFLTLFLFVSNSFSQPNWVKVASSITVEDYESDDAPAIILQNSSRSEIESNGSSTSKIEKAVRVLAPSGIESTYLNVSIDPLREVKNLKGWCISEDGTKQDLKKENIVITGFPSEAGYYDDQRILTAAFADVKTGDVVAYEYKIEEESNWEGYFLSFIFQSDLPVISSYFELKIPYDWELRTSEQNLETIEKLRSDNKYMWQSGYLPYRPDEPLMPDWESLRRQITVSCFNGKGDGVEGFINWTSVANWAFNKFEDKGPIDESMSNIIDGIVSSAATPEDKVRKVAEWIQKNIRYVAVELGTGRFEPRSAAVTMANKFGDCKDKSTLMNAILTHVNIPSEPVLANVGRNVDEKFPSPGQFNHVILSISTDEIKRNPDFERARVDGWLYFDPTDPITSIGCLPTRLCGTKVLRIDRSQSELIELPELAPEQRQRTYFAQAELLPNYSIRANVIIRDYGNKAYESRLYWRSTSVEDQLDEIKVMLSESIRDLEISEFQRHQVGDSAWLSFNLKGGQYLTEIGQLNLLKPNFLQPDRNNELTKETRIHPISFGPPLKINYEINWTLPEGLTLSGNLDTLRNESKQASITCILDFKDRVLQYRLERINYGLEFDPTEYEEAKRFENDLKSANRLKVFFEKPN